jgi:hypothetical protein
MRSISTAKSGITIKGPSERIRTPRPSRINTYPRYIGLRLIRNTPSVTSADDSSKGFTAVCTTLKESCSGIVIVSRSAHPSSPAVGFANGPVQTLGVWQVRTTLEEDGRGLAVSHARPVSQVAQVSACDKYSPFRRARNQHLRSENPLHKTTWIHDLHHLWTALTC